MSKAKCRKLGNRASKRDLIEAHRIELEMRRAKYAHLASGLDKEFIFANLSPKHDEFGETPSEQTRRMIEKTS